MYESLINELINRNVGDIGDTLRPTGGATSCPIHLGVFPWTYDGSTSTICMFREGTCTSEWYWDNPVKITNFNIFSHYYHSDSYINKIWVRVEGVPDWIVSWSGTWNPAHGVWDSKVIQCSNCTGIKISQVHALQTLKPGIAEVTVDYTPTGVETLTEAVTCKWVNGFQDHGQEVTQFDIDETIYAYAEIALHGQDAYGKIMKHEWWYNGVKEWEWQTACSQHYTNNWATWTWWAIGLVHGAGTGYIKIFYDGRYMGQTKVYTVISAEGKATIVSIYKPSNFTPNVSFHVKPKVRNDGADDYLFVKLTNTDTGEVLKDYTNPWITPAGSTWEHDMIVILDQTTDFHGRVDAGHIE